MSHPIALLQTELVAAWRADPALAALLGDAVFDAPPRGQRPPYLVIARHDLLPRDGDGAPGHDHRLLIHFWVAEASRKAVLTLVEQALAAALTAPLDGAGLLVTHRRHERTETSIDAATGGAKAAVTLRIYSEPAA